MGLGCGLRGNCFALSVSSSATSINRHALAFHPLAITNDVWKGGTGNWSNASMWSAGVPTSSNNVLIDNGNPAVSTVNLDINKAPFNTLTIDSDDTLHVNSGIVLTVSGNDVSNAGTLSNVGTISMSNGALGGKLNNSGTIEALSGSFSNELSGTVTNPAGGVIKIDNDAGLTLGTGTYTNAGTITLNSSGPQSDLVIGASSVTLGGTITMSNSANNLITGGTGDTLTNQGTIQGAGNIGDLTSLALVNSGTINANQSAGLTIAAKGGVTNSGTLEATGGGTLGFAANGAGLTVTNTGGTINTTGGTLSAFNTTINNGTVTLANGTLTGSTISGANVTVTGTSTVGLSNGSILGGTLKNSTTGTIEALSGSFSNELSGTVTNPAGGVIKIDNNAGLTLGAGTYTNAGTITLNSSGPQSDLVIGASKITLGGTITMSNSLNNLITGGTADTLTNQGTIQGAGNIGDLTSLVLVNSGTINANQPAGLTIAAKGGVTNNGTLSVASGDVLHVEGNAGTFTNFSGSTLTGGIYKTSGTLEIDQLGSTGGEILTDAANIVLNGATASFIDSAGKNALSNLNTIATGSSFSVSGQNFTTAGNFTNNGQLIVGGGSKFDVNGNLTNFSGTSLTGGTYNVSGTLQFNGANIVTNAANITLTGASSKITNQGGTVDALANFATNSSTGSFAISAGRNFTSAGNFTNNGTLNVGNGTKFDVSGNLTNFSGTKLTGGTYVIGGTLQFNGANIVTNAANLTLAGSAATIINQTSVNGLKNFTTNAATGKLTLSGSQSLTTAGGSVTNGGMLTVSNGSTLTIGGSSFLFTQTGGTSTIDGTLTSSTASTFNLNGGSLFGSGTVNYSLVDKATVTPGDSATKTGILSVKQTYTQGSGGVLNISIGGNTAGTQFDRLNVTSTAALGGTLNVTLINGFVPAVGATFDILNGSTVSGNWSTIHGLSINSSEHFTETVNPTDVVLTVVSGAAPLSATSLLAPTSKGRTHFGLVPPHRYSMAVVLPPAVRSVVARPVTAPLPHIAQSGKRFGMMDAPESALVSPTLMAAFSSAPGSYPHFGPVAATSPSLGIGQGHRRVEVVLDLNSVVKTGPKRLLKAFFADPDSRDAVSIGYISTSSVW
jgi:hypothetical protein